MIVSDKPSGLTRFETEREQCLSLEESAQQSLELIVVAKAAGLDDL